MNKLEIINELRRCAEPTQEGWDIWYHGAYLGTIVKIKTGKYMIIRESKDAPVGIRNNFMAAISSFTDAAYEIYLADYKESSGTYMPVVKIYIDGFTNVGALGENKISVEIRKVS